MVWERFYKKRKPKAKKSVQKTKMEKGFKLVIMIEGEPKQTMEFLSKDFKNEEEVMEFGKKLSLMEDGFIEYKISVEREGEQSVILKK